MTHSASSGSMSKMWLSILAVVLLALAAARAEAGLVRLTAKAGKRVVHPAAKVVKAVAKGAKKVIY